MKRLLPFLFLPVLALAAPSTPITRGRLTTDLDAAGHSITNGPMATTNFVWEALANFAPGGGDDAVRTNAVGEAWMSSVTLTADNIADWQPAYRGQVRAGFSWGHSGLLYDSIYRYYDGVEYFYTFPDYGGRLVVDSDIGALQGIRSAAYHSAGDFAARTNIPTLPASATVGELVDTINAVANALRKEEP